MEKKSLRYFFVLNILFQSVISIKKLNYPIGSLFIFKGMFFQPKNVPIGKMRINSDNDILNDNNNTDNNDLIKKEESEINDDKTIVEKIMKNKVIREEKKKYFIYVDPLDDFGAATVARNKCAEAG